MTAILRILTPFGFLVAADGRETFVGNDGQFKNCDEKKKIFAFQDKVGVIAYAFVGIISNQDESFSIVDLAANAAQQLSDTKFEDFKKYIYRFSRIIKKPLSTALGDGQFKPAFPSGHPDPNERDTICRIVFAGYYRSSAVYGYVRFRHPLKIEISVESPIIGKWMVNGPRIANLVLDPYSQDPRLKSFRSEGDCNMSLEWAMESARRFIKACETDEAQKIDTDCRRVGGRIRAIAIVPSGFRWIDVN